jgi:hypothetical protein
MKLNSIIKLILSIGMIYNIIKGNTQTAILLGICIIINLFYERTR